MSADTPEISVIIPCKDEAENITILMDEIRDALQGRAFEVVVVDDGSSDGTGDVVLRRFEAGETWARAVRHARSAGQSSAVRTGVFAARGAILVTIDGDGQNNPAFIPELVDRLKAGGAKLGMVAGQRQKRTDSLAKRYASRFANKLRGAMLKDRTRDSGCGLKAVRAEVFRVLPYFDGWHRYMAALVLREGYDIDHLDVTDRPRRFGASKYGIFDRALIGVLDLIGVWWLRRRRKVVPQVSPITPAE
ncbi:MAG: glycosyltransferase family 2 protein [Hyphomicrobiaceae bacterium]|nr:glycosyltransferase family 2 protein [Hyphomicrobiaceae bacterium]